MDDRDERNEPTKTEGAGADVIDLQAWKAKREIYKLAESADWASISRRLTRHARSRIGKGTTGDEPEDLAQAAIAHFFKNMHKWDPSARTLLAHLASVLNGIAIDRKRIGPNRGAHRREKPDGGVEPLQLAAPDLDVEPNATPHADAHARPAGGFAMPDTSREVAVDGERLIVERDRARRIVEATTRGLAKDTIALAVLRAFAQHIDSPTEQAETLRLPLLTILAARRRIERHAKQALADLEGTDES